jgi:hypothetical protein
MTKRPIPTGLHGTIGTHKHICGATVLGTANTICKNAVLVLVTNKCDTEIRLRKGKYLTSFKPLSYDECPLDPPPFSTEQVNNISPSSGKTDDESKKAEHIRDEYNIDMSQYNADHAPELVDIIYKNKEAFIDSSNQLGYNDWFPQKIQLKPGTRPITRQPYRLSPEMKEAMEEQIQQLVKQGVLVHSNSCWSSPIIAVKKGVSKAQKHVKTEGPPSYRLVVDFRYLNANSVPEQTHINNVRELIDEVGASRPRYFTTLDAKSGFFQQSLDPESQPLTAFLFNRRSYQFRTFPQGLHGSPFCFQKLIYRTLDLVGDRKHVFCYIDDILIVGRTWQQHADLLDRTLAALIQANLKLGGNKCRFGMEQATFLGYELSPKGVSISDKHVSAITTWPIPTTQKQVRSFLGAANYFRAWIKDRGSLIKPLTSLTKKDAPFKWTEECQANFEEIKRIMSSRPILAYPDFETPFELYTDASQEALGAMLAQRHPDTNELHPVAYLGRGTSRQESAWNITELEALGVIYAVKEFSVYLSGKPFKIYTDHNALVHIFNSTKLQTSNKLTRYAMFMSDYVYEIFHVPGLQINIADALSRRPYAEEDPEDPWQDPTLKVGFSTVGEEEQDRIMALTRAQAKQQAAEDKQDITNTVEDAAIVKSRQKSDQKTSTSQTDVPIKDIITDRVDIPAQDELPFYATEQFLSSGDIRKAQDEDEYCSDLINMVLHDQLPSDPIRRRRCDRREFDFCIRTNMLVQIWTPIPGKEVIFRIVIPRKLQIPLVQQLHESKHSAHLGLEKMISLLRARFIFKSMYEVVRTLIGSCDVCLRVKQNNRPIRTPQGLYDMTSQPWHRAHVDFAGPFEASRRHGNRYICLVVDSCSSYVVAWPCRNLTAASYAENFYSKISCVYGNPKQLVSDNGSTFHAQLWKELASQMQIRLTFIAPYHAATNGGAEASVKRIKQTLQCLTQTHIEDWDRLLAPATYTLNASCIGPTNISPYTVLFGRLAPIPIDTGTEEIDIQPFHEVVDQILQGQAKAIDIVTKFKAARYKQTSPAVIRKSDELTTGEVVFWQRPLHTGDGVHKQKFTGPYVVFARSGGRAQIRDLDTGKFHPLKVHISQLRKATRYQLKDNHTQYMPTFAGKGGYVQETDKTLLESIAEE